MLLASYSTPRECYFRNVSKSLSQVRCIKHGDYNVTVTSSTLKQGMTELPDYNKIVFPEMPPIPLENIVPDASPEVGEKKNYHIISVTSIFILDDNNLRISHSSLNYYYFRQWICSSGF